MRVVQHGDMLSKVPPLARLMDAMRDAYEEYSAGNGYVADVQHVHVQPQDEDSEGGHACVKSGYIRGHRSWVVKVAAGFPGNSALGLSTSQGCMLLFSQATGALECVLADDGHLTDIRTAAAACLCIAKFKPARAASLAILGTGVIARLIAEYAVHLGFGGVIVASRTPEAADAFAAFAYAKGWAKVSRESHAAAAARADVVVCCTPSTEPLVPAVKPGALVVALGADGPGKRELGPTVLQGDVVLLVDSKSQCESFGEAAYRPEGLAMEELGEHKWAGGSARATPATTIVCDLTGIATQDVAIACAVRDAVVAAEEAAILCEAPAPARG
jgi:ornithine cyclodeaminase